MRELRATTLGAGSIALAVVTIQAVAFSTFVAAGASTWYVPFALASAVAVGYGGGRGWFGAALAALGTVLLLALGLPLGLFVARVHPDLVAEQAASPAVHRMLYLTVYGPLVAAVAALAFGIPIAYLLAEGFPGRPVVESLVDLPLVVPHSVAGILVLFGFGRQGILPGFPILGTMLGMVLALTFVSAPYAVNAAREGFENVDRRLEYAARAHGATRFETFRRVSAPLAARGILTGGVLAWARGVSEFGAVAVVAYSVEFFYPPAGKVVRSQHAPVYVFTTFTSGTLAQASAVAFILLAVSAVVFLLIRWLGYRGGDVV